MSPHEQIAAVAQAMLDGSTELLDGCRVICELQHQLPQAELRNNDLLVIVGIASELDECPTGDVRQHWDPAARADKDRQRDDYLRRVGGHLMAACRALAMWR